MRLRKYANCPPESGGQRHRVLRDDARGGSLNEMSKNDFPKKCGYGTTPRAISTAVSIVLPS
jgi:hypothetical protein